MAILGGSGKLSSHFKSTEMPSWAREAWKSNGMYMRAEYPFFLGSRDELPKHGMVTKGLCYPLIPAEGTEKDIFWPTVVVRGMKGGTAHRAKFRKMVLDNLISEVEALEMASLQRLWMTSESGKKPSGRFLNPDWVEWLMGFPLEWSKLP